MCATDGSGNGETALWVALIVLGGVVCIAIIVTVAIMLKRTATYRKEAEHYERQQKYATSLTRGCLLYNEAQQDAKVAQTTLTYIFTVHGNEEIPVPDVSGDRSQTVES